MDANPREEIILASAVPVRAAHVWRRSISKQTKELDPISVAN